MLAIGLLYGYYALAQAPEQTNFTNDSDYYANTLTNRLGLPEGYELALVKPVRKRTGNGYGGQCVIFARNYLKLPYSSFHGWAGRIPANSQTPTVNSVALTRGHAAVVLEVRATGVLVIDSNWHLDQRILIHELSYSIIRGYYQTTTN